MKRNYYFLFFSNFFDFLIICWLCLFCICCCFWQKFTSFLPCLFHCYVELCMWGGYSAYVQEQFYIMLIKIKLRFCFLDFVHLNFSGLDGFCLVCSRFLLTFPGFPISFQHTPKHPKLHHMHT